MDENHGRETNHSERQYGTRDHLCWISFEAHALSVMNGFVFALCSGLLPGDKLAECRGVEEEGYREEGFACTSIWHSKVMLTREKQEIGFQGRTTESGG